MLGANLGGRQVLAQRVLLDDAVARRIGARRSFLGDLVGHPFEVASMERHEPHSAAQRAALFDLWPSEERCEA